MLVCTFAGHRIINENVVAPLVNAAITELLRQDSDFLFYDYPDNSASEVLNMGLQFL